MKKICISFLLVLFAALGVSAAPIPYWTLTDFTTSVNGTANFTLQIQNFFNPAADADFGIFYNNGGTAVGYDIFSKSAGVADVATVGFTWTGSGYTIDIYRPGDTTPSVNDVAFSDVFGFYFEWYRADPLPTPDNTVDAAYYTDSSFDWKTYNPGFVLLTKVGPSGTADFSLYSPGGSEQRTVIKVHVADVAPVPEPVSMLLFGTGLVGLGGYVRRRFKK